MSRRQRTLSRGAFCAGLLLAVADAPADNGFASETPPIETVSIVIGPQRHLVLHLLGERRLYSPGDRLLLRWNEDTGELRLNTDRVYATPWEIPVKYEWRDVRDFFSEVPFIQDRRTVLSKAGSPDSLSWTGACRDWELAQRAVYVDAWIAFTATAERGARGGEAGRDALSVVRASDLVESATLTTSEEESQQVIDVHWKGCDYTEEMYLIPGSPPIPMQGEPDRGFARADYESARSLLALLSPDAKRFENALPLVIEFGDGNGILLTGDAADAYDLQNAATIGGGR